MKRLLFGCVRTAAALLAVAGAGVARSGPAIAVSFRAPAPTAESIERLLRTVDLRNSGATSVYQVPAPYTRAAFVDVDLDGNLDVYLFAGGRPDQLLRNSADGTFTDITAKTGDATFRARRVVVSDIDRDGKPDLVVIDVRGDLVARMNLGRGVFRTVPLGVSHANDLAVEDVNGDGVPDILVGTSAGLRLLVGKGDGSFSDDTGTAFAGAQGSAASPAPVRAVVLADFDNDGFPDVIAAVPGGLRAYRNLGGGKFADWEIFSSSSKKSSSSSSLSSNPARVEALLAVDVDNDGDLDLLVYGDEGTSVMVNDGGNANGWIVVALEGLPSGSGRVSREGVGSLVDVKAGNLHVARTVGVLPTHVGLGSRARADVVRAVWTNGVSQNVFDQKTKTVVRLVQPPAPDGNPPASSPY